MLMCCRVQPCYANVVINGERNERMGIQLTWDNAEQTALRCAFDERWTWDEADATMLEVKRITDSATHEIDAIIDLSKGVNIPGSIFNPATMQHARKMLKMGETNG